MKSSILCPVKITPFLHQSSLIFPFSSSISLSIGTQCQKETYTTSSILYKTLLHSVTHVKNAFLFSFFYSEGRFILLRNKECEIPHRRLRIPHTTLRIPQRTEPFRTIRCGFRIPSCGWFHIPRCGFRIQLFGFRIAVFGPHSACGTKKS